MSLPEAEWKTVLQVDAEENQEEKVLEDLEALVVVVGKLSHLVHQLWLLGLIGHWDEQRVVPNK